eukprot:gene10629-12310_t
MSLYNSSSNPDNDVMHSQVDQNEQHLRNSSPPQVAIKQQNTNSRIAVEHLAPLNSADNLILLVLVAIWYLFSYLFNSQLKIWFAQHGESDTLFPLLLTIFLANTLATSAWTMYSCSRERAILGTHFLSQLVVNQPTDFLLLCACGVIGVTATCVVLQHGSIQLVQVARSVGPLFTAFWAYLVLNQSTSGVPLLYLAVTLLGTALASWNEPSFNTTTFLLMLTVNATLTFRNTSTKRIITHHSTHSPTLLASALLALTSAVGLVLVALLWLLSTFLSPSPAPSSPPLGAAPLEAFPSYQHLLILGTCNFAYNLASQLVLARVPVVSHGMLELFKRVFVLGTAYVLLADVQWAWHNIVGALVATLGTVLYFLNKHKAGHDNEQKKSQAALHDLHSPSKGAKPSQLVPSRLYSFSSGLQQEADGRKLYIARTLIIVLLLLSPLGFLQSAGWATPAWLSQMGGLRPSGAFQAGMHQLGFTPWHGFMGGSTDSSTDGKPTSTQFMGVWSGWIGRRNLGDEIVHDLFLDLLGASLMERTASSTKITVSRFDEALNKGMPGCNFEDMSACNFAVIVYVDYIKRVAAVLENPNSSVILFGSGYQSGLLSKGIGPRYLTLLCNRRLLGHLRGYGAKVAIIRDSALMSGLVYSGGRTSLSDQLDKLGVPESGTAASRPGGRKLVVMTSKERLDPVIKAVAVSLLTTGEYVVALQNVDDEGVEEHKRLADEINLALPHGAAPHTDFAAVQALYQRSIHTDFAAVQALYQRASASLNARLYIGAHTDFAAVQALYQQASASLNARLHIGAHTDFDAVQAQHQRASASFNARLHSGVHELKDKDPAVVAAAAVSLLTQAISNRSSTDRILQHYRSQTLLDYQKLMTLLAYEELMRDLLNDWQRQHPARYHSLMCCNHIHISRSQHNNSRSLFLVECK